PTLFRSGRGFLLCDLIECVPILRDCSFALKTGSVFTRACTGARFAAADFIIKRIEVWVERDLGRLDFIQRLLGDKIAKACFLVEVQGRSDVVAPYRAFYSRFEYRVNGLFI